MLFWSIIHRLTRNVEAMRHNKITFNKSSTIDFAVDVKRRVNEYFQVNGLSKKANGSMILKTAVLLTLTYGSYALLLSGDFTPVQMLLLCFLMGIGMAGIGFCISHDALHGAYSSNNTVNAILGFSFDLLGANGYIWKITHNAIHHTYTNVHGLDEDLVVSDFIRLCPGTERKPIHRFQHISAFFAYSLSTLYWVFVKDYKYFLKRDLGPYTHKKHPRSQILILIVTKAIYYAYTIVIPIRVLHLTAGEFLVGYLVVHLTAGLILGVVFQLAHVVEGTEFPRANTEGEMENAWVIHQLETTSDFARKNRLLSWYIGGLNFQIEHHLFPKVCSIHYPAISSIVENVALKHNLPYHSHDTLREAISSHYRTLKKFGDPEWAPAPTSA